MIAFLHHWVWTDFWGPVWPNIAASPVIAAYVTVSRMVAEVRAERRHRAAEHAAQARHDQLLAATAPAGEAP